MTRLRAALLVLLGLAAAAADSAPPPAAPDATRLPAIILKFDDLKGEPKLQGLWQRLTGYLEAERIPASIGIIADSLEHADPAYLAYLRSLQAGGRIELWFHGWDHATRQEDGRTYGEFVHRSYAEQKRRFDLAQAAARERLGAPFRTFGPPGGAAPSFDAETVRVMADDPDMAVWLYPTPLDAAGRTLAAAGKVTVLDRVWEVNLESKVGVADATAFAAGFARHLDRPYLVLQGHPAAWNAERWNEFTRIIALIRERGCAFTTPLAYAARAKATAGP